MNRNDFEELGTDGVIMSPVPGTYFKVCASNETGSSVAFSARVSFELSDVHMTQLKLNPENAKYTDWFIMRMDNYVHMRIVTEEEEDRSWVVS